MREYGNLDPFDLLHHFTSKFLITLEKGYLEVFMCVSRNVSSERKVSYVFVPHCE
jgi:hypothetical protein